MDGQRSLAVITLFVIAEKPRKVLMFNKRKTISYSIYSPFSLKKSHKITLTIGRQF